VGPGPRGWVGADRSKGQEIGVKGGHKDQEISGNRWVQVKGDVRKQQMGRNRWVQGPGDGRE
jgi:hypothetical protein